MPTMSSTFGSDEGSGKAAPQKRATGRKSTAKKSAPAREKASPRAEAGPGPKKEKAPAPAPDPDNE